MEWSQYTIASQTDSPKEGGGIARDATHWQTKASDERGSKRREVARTLVVVDSILDMVNARWIQQQEKGYSRNRKGIQEQQRGRK